MTAREKYFRDLEIVEDRKKGVRWEIIAARYGLTERQCQNVWRAHQDNERQVPLGSAREAIRAAALRHASAAASDRSAKRETDFRLEEAQFRVAQGVAEGVSTPFGVVDALEAELLAAEVRRISEAIAAAREQSLPD